MVDQDAMKRLISEELPARMTRMVLAEGNHFEFIVDPLMSPEKKKKAPAAAPATPTASATGSPDPSGSAHGEVQLCS